MALIEKIIKARSYKSLYWKESCFGLTAETLIDRAAVLTLFGSQYGNQKPTEFLCVLKLLQLQPEENGELQPLESAFKDLLGEEGDDDYMNSDRCK
ncbi:PRP38-domain-containing protein [Gigaspora margarita]|uniref:Pre-mRNA-splicing factor 38 n=1 Tax=Gigaspora margarita TaxID=4874 RepID=A0A8H4A554_GIGMA|nr:PRP38-domain-containing protein [Gigaspora margarita]